MLLWQLVCVAVNKVKYTQGCYARLLPGTVMCVADLMSHYCLVNTLMVCRVKPFTSRSLVSKIWLTCKGRGRIGSTAYPFHASSFDNVDIGHGKGRTSV